MIPGGGRPMAHGSYLLFFVCVVVGVATGAGHREHETYQIPPDPNCGELEWRDGMDTEGWDMLIDQGYVVHRTTDGLTLMPPGCEGSQ